MHRKGFLMVALAMLAVVGLLAVMGGTLTLGAFFALPETAGPPGGLALLMVCGMGLLIMIGLPLLLLFAGGAFFRHRAWGTAGQDKPGHMHPGAKHGRGPMPWCREWEEPAEEEPAEDQPR